MDVDHVLKMVGGKLERLEAAFGGSSASEFERAHFARRLSDLREEVARVRSFLRDGPESTRSPPSSGPSEEDSGVEGGTDEAARGGLVDVAAAARGLFEGRTPWGDGSHPYAPRALWGGLGAALYGEDDPRVLELRANESDAEPKER